MIELIPSMEYSELALLVGASILAFVTLVWFLSLALRDSGIMDIFWGLGFIVVAFVSATATGLFDADSDFPSRWLLVLGLVTIWGIRLAAHIGVRNHGKPEDFRYAKWRADAGASWWWRSYFKVFLLQGLVMAIVSAPIVAVLNSRSPTEWTLWDAAGLSLWLIGFLFEAIGDEQLRRFKSDAANGGKVMDSGLWRYTRHPNYFGEAVLWWGIWLIACAVPLGWATVFAPALMTWLLLRVSGVSMLERGLASTKPGYQEYVRSTNAFIPGPARSTSDRERNDV